MVVAWALKLIHVFADDEFKVKNIGIWIRYDSRSGSHNA